MAYNRATYIRAVPAQFFTNTGAIASGYKLFVYTAGTTTKTTTYTDATAAVSNANPVVLDSSGRATIFLDSSGAVQYYKFVLATPTTADPPAGGDIVWTRDAVGVIDSVASNVDVIGSAGENLTAGQVVAMQAGNSAWYRANPAVAGRSIDAVL